MSMAPKDWDEIRSKIVAPVIGAIGEADDNGATENLGTPTAKLNAIIGITPKVVCKGYMGTVFTLSRSDKYYKDIVTEITVDSVSVGDDLYINVIPVPLGNWNIKIDVNGMTIYASVNVTELGKVYTFSYSSYKTIAEFSSPGTYTVDIPDDVSEIYLDAAGAGGGGLTSKSDYGRGGGGGAAVANKKYTVTPGSTIQVTVGKGGTGEYIKQTSATEINTITEAKDGTATVVGNLVTLPGGKSGKNGGVAGGTGGGNGGQCSAGAPGIIGKGGPAGAVSGYTSVGGGGGSYGDGGKGGSPYPRGNGSSGTKGGGGGAAPSTANNVYPSITAGSGGNGYIRIKHGIQVNA